MNISVVATFEIKSNIFFIWLATVTVKNLLAITPYNSCGDDPQCSAGQNQRTA